MTLIDKDKEKKEEERKKKIEEANNRKKANKLEREKIKELKAELEELGVYSESNDDTIALLAKKMVMMEKLWSSITSSDFIFSSGTAAGNPKGNPEATLFLNLAKSIETHQEKLGLTPSGYLALTGKNTTTPTDSQALKNALSVDLINEKIDALMNKDEGSDEDENED